MTRPELIRRALELTEAGYSRSRTAAALGVTKGVVSGIIYHTAPRRAKPGRYLTDADRAFIAASWSTMRNEDIALAIGRSQSGVSAAARNMGLPSKKHHRGGFVLVDDDRAARERPIPKQIKRHPPCDFGAMDVEDDPLVTFHPFAPRSPELIGATSMAGW